MDNSQQPSTDPQIKLPTEATENAGIATPSSMQPTVTAHETPLSATNTELGNMASSPSANSTSNFQSALPAPGSHKSNKGASVLKIVIVILLVLAAGTGGYLFGNRKQNKKSVVQSQSTAAKDQELTVPQGATVIAQCAKGRGTQYALPKDIPLGPVYNVYEGKVIGIEFMVGKDDLLVGAKSYLNLPLESMKYDHVNIGLLSQGHAGFPTPHYHVDIMTVPTSITDKITCT